MKTEKILVFSDSHGSTLLMKTLLEAPPEGLTAVFHLGDGAEEARRLMDKYPMYAFISVKGNCDAPFEGSRETVFTDRGGVRFMLTHGHEYGVKSSLMRAVMKAAEGNAEVLLYGHTHVADHERFDGSFGGVSAVNPGSARMMEYALITVEDGKAEVELKRYSAVQ